MLIIQIVLTILLIIPKCIADVSMIAPGDASAVPHLPAITPAAPKCNVNGTLSKKSYGLKFRLPFMDMEIQNQRNLRIMQEPHKQQLFVLHGNELYQMFVSRGEKRLSLIGLLSGSVREMEHLGAEVISWHNYILLIVALEEYLEVYQISELRIAKRAEIAKDPKRSNETALIFEPIQQLTIPGKFQKIYLTNPENDVVMLILAVNFTKLYGKFRTFEWSNTYFNPIEELTVPPMNILQVVGSYPKYIVSGRAIKHQSKTILTIYEVMLPSLNLRRTQTLTVNSRIVHATTFQNRSYIIACESQQKKCNSFRMTDTQFKVHKLRTDKELAFNKFVGGPHFFVGSRLNEIMVYVSGRLDCYVAFTSNETEVSSILTHINQHNEEFIILNYVRPFKTLVRMVELETDDGELLGAIAANLTESEDLGPVRQHQHMFEDTVGKLRSILLKRKPAMDVFRKLAAVMSPKVTSLKLKKLVQIHAGNIGIIKVVGKTLRSPVELMTRIGNMAQSFHKTRFGRSSDRPHNFALTMPKRLKVSHLYVRNLIYDGSILEGFHLDKESQALPTLSVMPAIVTKLVHTQQILTRQSRGSKRQLEPFDNDIRTLKTGKLYVQRINGIPWTVLYSSLFLKNRDTKLKGRLILQAESEIGELWTPLLNSLRVDQLFNLKQPQVVNSNILISRFFVSDLRADLVNGINFAEDIVFRGIDTFVETPVIMHQISIAGDLLLADNTKIKRLTDESELNFQQHYTGKVIINGSLTINNLLREDAENTHILVADMPFSEADLKERYMLKYEPQEFNTTVTFGNAKVTIPMLKTNYLNSHPIEQHLLKSGVPSLKKPLLLVFMLVSVEGDLICTDYSSKLLELQRNAVLHGEIANVTGIKIFEAPLTIDHLMTLELNNMSVSELVPKSQLEQECEFKNNKHFENVLVTEKAVVEQQLNASYLNNLPLNELLNYDYHLDSLSLKHKLQALNIVFHKINGVPFDEVFTKFNIRDEQLVLHKQLIIEGNVQFGENLRVQMINDIDWNAYYVGLVRNNENAVVTGPIQFLNELTITKDLNTPLINNLNILEIFANILSKSKAQLITGSYTFDNLNLSNLDVSVINDVPTAAFIDTRVKSVTIDGDIIVPKITVHGNIKGKFTNQFDFDKLQRRLQELPSRQWRNVMVHGNAYWNATDDNTQEERLQYLHANAVKRLANQVITGNVHLKRPLISKMITKKQFPKSIDFDFIAKDCLYKNTTTAQVIMGAKNFIKPLQLQKVTANSLFNSKLLNKIDILRFNASLYRLSSGQPINGALHFKTPPVIGHLAVKGSINGIRPAQIYHPSNSALPPIKMRHLTIDNTLQLQDINDMSLDYLLQQRVTKHGEALEVFGFLTFEHLILSKQILLQSINDIPIDNLVFKKCPHMQAITGTKTIAGNLKLAGPTHVLRLNGKDLIESYQKSVFTNRPAHFDNLIIEQATFASGLTLANEKILSSTAAVTFENVSLIAQRRQKLNAITRDLQQIDKFIDNTVVNKEPKQHLMYLDYDLNTQLSWQLPNDTLDTTVKSSFYEITRLSMCARQLLQVQKMRNRLLLRNITTNFITANVADLHVKAENYCKSKYRKVKSKITIATANLSQVFGMKKFIETVEIYAHNASTYFVLLHAIDLTTNRNEVRILRIDNSTNNISDWQSLTLGVGKVMRLFNYPNNTLLVSAALINKQPVLSIYKFSADNAQFKLLQIIDGDYDIMELIALSANRYQLILSCRHCQRIRIYEYQQLAEPPYHILQLIKLKTRIDKLLPFTLSDGSLYLLVLSERAHDFYHLYKYSHIQGWLHYTYGYFHNIEMALPLISERGLRIDGDNLLLLLCGGNKCSLVKAFVQQQ